MFTQTKKVLAIVVSVLAFSSLSMGQASADQTINVDLDNFLPDDLGGNGWPNYNVYGVSDGDTITFNVTNNGNSLFEAYISDSPNWGFTFMVSGDGEINIPELVQNGNVVSWVQPSHLGPYVLAVTLGDDALLDEPDTFQSAFAAYTSSPENAMGVVFFAKLGELTLNTKSVSLLRSGRPITPNALRLDTAGTTTEKNNVVSCTPGKYTFLNGGSTAETAKVQSYVYTLLINGTAVSTISSDGFKSVASHLFPTIAGNMAGSATLDGATWNLAGMSNYSAQCQVYATQSGGNIQSVTTTTHDAVALAAAAEAAAKAQMTKDMIANWAASNEELAKKYRDNRLAGKP